MIDQELAARRRLPEINTHLRSGKKSNQDFVSNFFEVPLVLIAPMTWRRQVPLCPEILTGNMLLS